MKNFFRFLFMGICDALKFIGLVIGLTLPFIFGITISLLLKHISKPDVAVFFGTSTVLIGYWLYSVVPHCIDAAKYFKKTGTDSLKEAWNETYPKTWPV